MGQAPLHGSGNPDGDAFDRDTVDHRVAPYKSRRSAQTDLSVRLQGSGRDGEPDAGEYVSSLLRKQKAVMLPAFLAGSGAAAAVAILFVMVFPNVARDSAYATRDIALNVRASVAAAFSAPSAAADASQVAALEQPNNDARRDDPSRSSLLENATTGQSVATAAVQPVPEQIKTQYQDALQNHAPATDPIMPAESLHHLDPEAIAALLKRADALIASSDVAAARLVLRRAADAADASAALRLAETYDPANLAKWGVHGIVPDVSMARSWYEKARQFGSADAPQRLERLAGKRQ
jgi:hypothetical protein